MIKSFAHSVLLAAAPLALWAGAATAADAPASGTPTATTQAAPPSYRERYTVLSDRNIFVKERFKIVKESDARPDRGPRRDDAPRRPLESGFVLTGVVLEEGLFRAYVEDSNASRILRLTSGDSVANGHIGTIAIDAVAYVANGQTKTIPIGSDLTGTPISLSSSQSGGGGGYGSGGYGSGGYGSGGSPRGNTTGPTTGSSIGSTTGGPPPAPLPDPNNPNLSLEERMRLRRAQELRK